ncbi:hypothetical protein WN51_14462 [Melipona quadrifasciata]|uniref:Uncharacterized protein n=1 Tax=Melipona quadrifasciata TaxID=166423 RepID=A0A0M8ZZS1_9HYME|nr:hypothetical protein WN51_14462 [Melipona quadrifasciata]
MILTVYRRLTIRRKRNNFETTEERKLPCTFQKEKNQNRIEKLERVIVRTHGWMLRMDAM